MIPTARLPRPPVHGHWGMAPRRAVRARMAMPVGRRGVPIRGGTPGRGRWGSEDDGVGRNGSGIRVICALPIVPGVTTVRGTRTQHVHRMDACKKQESAHDIG